MKLIKRGVIPIPASEVTCKNCSSIILVEEHEWKPGYYASERKVDCLLCKKK